MKRIFAAFFIIALCAAFARAETHALEPAANAFEARAIKSAMSAESDGERFEILKKACADSSAGAALFFNFANICASRKDWNLARENYLKALRAFPDFYKAKYNLALVEYSDSNWRAALSRFGESLALSYADCRQIMKYSGFCHYRLGNYSSALACFENSLVFLPGDAEMSRAKAVCLRKLGRTGELREFLGESLRANPADSHYRRLRARLSYSEGDYLAAAADIEALKSLGRAQAEDYSILTHCYLSLKAYSFAALNAQNSDIKSDRLCEISMALALSADTASAEKFLERADKNSAPYFESLALLESLSGKNPLKNLERANLADPKNPRIILKLAAQYLKDGKIGLAEAAYREALPLDEQPALEGICNVKIARGEYADAASIFSRLREKNGAKYPLSFLKKLEELANESKR